MPISYRKSKIRRRSRVIGWSWRLWKPRIVFWLGAIAIGVVSVGFAAAADEAQRLFRSLTRSGHYGYLIPLALTPAGFLVSAILSMRLFPNAQGSGIPQAIAARHLDHTEARAALLSPRLVVGKILLTVVGLFSGASIGREGPTVQVGAAIMLASGRIGGMAQARGLILAGSAAGIAAAFNTPLAGIVFAIEEMSRTFQSRANGLVLTAVILSGLAAMGMVGSYTYFGESIVSAASPLDWVAVVLCGIVGGALGAGFSRMALAASRRIRVWAHPDPFRRMLAVAAVCGFAVAVIGVLAGGSTFGTGYEESQSVLVGEPLSPLFFIGKLGATFLSMVSGIPGGIFAPSLSIGVGLGGTIGSLIGASIALSGIVGMAGYFAGVVQAPMTAFVIIIEMTGNHEAVLPIMAAAMLGYITSRLVSPEPLYHGLSRAFIAQAIRQRRNVARAGEPVPAAPSAQ
ncbi:MULTISPECIES: chloride channel protein [Alphaproteobacteria]|uniref:Chloride channel protein n=2 Tax=Alphaproteobacteria TaxID=28211 RepID=A0A512HFK0_9HYPH|nr:MULTISPECIES: chloride channel protein [Alphaproteobacteria]GEO84229.1 chloride channel protein [Ciceribacter naphthalenivorans]GLR24765.1 chloride channel protein [Ciceribacter naphthalenivorans]GLT07621.1 chloride channel protein [Sphingomonas psychrolutea]